MVEKEEDMTYQYSRGWWVKKAREAKKPKSFPRRRARF